MHTSLKIYFLIHSFFSILRFTLSEVEHINILFWEYDSIFGYLFLRHIFFYLLLSVILKVLFSGKKFWNLFHLQPMRDQKVYTFRYFNLFLSSSWFTNCFKFLFGSHWGKKSSG